jgi:hypothetical protein
MEGDRGEGEAFWEKIYKEMVLFCQEGNAGLPSTSLRSAQGEPRLALRPLPVSRARNCKFMFSLVMSHPERIFLQAFLFGD